MKKQYCKLYAFLLVTSLLAGVLPLFSVADGSHGFYMDCDASVVQSRANGFMIDFYSDSEEALCTYWSNANWSMYTVDTAKRMGCAALKGGGAYAGLQILDLPTQRKGIMSLWRYEYKNKEGNTDYIYAKALYGVTTTYDNEGSGTSCVMDFDWKSNAWYRQLLYCWKDLETGYTFIGTWFYDYDADEWTLFAYYNTYLWNSYIEGGVGQFLENFSESQGARYRSFRYRNVYFLSRDNEWVSSPTVKIRSDGNPKAFGETKLGVSEDGTYVWASVDGTSLVDSDEEISLKPTLVQGEKPVYGTPEIDSVKVQGGKVSWEMDLHSTPMLTYTVRLLDAEGNQIGKRFGSRPEVRSVDFGEIEGDLSGYEIEISLTDVFGQTVTESHPVSVKNPTESGEQTAKPSENPAINEGQEVQKTPDDGSSFKILPIAVTVIAVCAVLAVLPIVIWKRKRK